MALVPEDRSLTPFDVTIEVTETDLKKVTDLKEHGLGDRYTFLAWDLKWGTDYTVSDARIVEWKDEEGSSLIDFCSFTLSKFWLLGA